MFRLNRIFSFEDINENHVHTEYRSLKEDSNGN